ncbi:MAG: signal peptidase II [Clostridia bacterium]|nr:signal peptidase II [Clostridia bacterium]
MKRISVYLGAIILIFVDQLTKLAVIDNLKDKSITIIKDILNFTYCENRGVAFSIGNGHVPTFIVVNLIIICVLTVYYEKNKEEFQSLLNKIFFTMVIAGGASNLVDRVLRGFVVDFIDINGLFDFAIFNIADVFIVVGIIGLVISIFIGELKKINEKNKQ